MPSTVPVITGLTYKGTDLQDFPRTFLQIIEGGPDWNPEVRGEPRVVPYRTGQIYAPRRGDRLPIMLEGWVSGEGADEATQRSDTAAARQAMKVLFDGTSGPGTLACTTEDGTDWTIEAYPDLGPVWEAMPRIPTHWTFSVRLMAIGDDNEAFWVAGS